jgi:chromosome segregation protein
LRIKSLEINGFKSFVDKTAFRFQAGITAIVGPNGCGKSNVVDAVRWVMGEQAPRRLRGKAMDDVIFAGAEARAPVGMAEVVLCFDNGEGQAPAAFSGVAEIQVARRLYRTGESEYLINRVPCRLRDVLDFFRDTGIGRHGYTIVEQGRIAEIVSAKPEERRLLIEEAAGISKYKARRQEAERRIASTQQNLARVTDVLGEIRRQIASIERQARRAAHYKRLREHLRVLDLSLAADDRRDQCVEIDSARHALRALRDDATALETRAAEREVMVEKKRLEQAELERGLAKGSEALYELRSAIKELESRIEYERRERETLVELRRVRGEELEGLVAQLAGLEGDAERAQADLSGLEASLADEAGRLADAEAEARVALEALRRLERERDDANQAHVEVLTRIARDEDRVSALRDRRAELDQRLRSAEEALELLGGESGRNGREEGELAEGLRRLLAERDRLMDLLRGALDREAGTRQEAREVGLRLRDAREARETRRARAASLRELLERHEDLAPGTRRWLDVPEDARRARGVAGLVREAFEVQPGFEVAVEVALGARADALLVDSLEAGVGALAWLRQEAAGPGVFFAPPPESDEPRGFVPLGAPLLEKVSPRPGYESLARALLAGVNWVEDLGEALSVYGARLPACFVTREGDWLGDDGTLRGGGRRGGAFSRARELAELQRECESLDFEVSRLEIALRAAEVTAARTSDEVDNLRNRHHTAALAVANHEKDLERIRERAKSLLESIEGRREERAALVAAGEAVAAELDRIDAQLVEARSARLTRQRALEEAALRIGTASREVARLEAHAAEQRVAHGSRAERRERLASELERLVGSMGETREWIERREAEIRAAEARVEELAGSAAFAESRLADHLRSEEHARLGHVERREAYEREAEALREVEAQARALRGEAAARRESLQRAELDLRERDLRLEHLDAAVRERWGVELAAWLPPAPGEVPPAAAAEGEEGVEEPVVDAASLAALPRDERQAELERVRARLESLGEVNLGAIEEHEELRERFRFLGEQKADLESTLASLDEAIQRINRTSRRRFRETFDAVNARFSENFPRLFRGGKATLQLAEGEDVLEAGVEIVAQPPGKRLQNMNLLSGGEKTMTALALLIALFQVRPSPFFLLDEVDAALDDANVGRFNEIVREMAATSQFLMITHNKRTIEIADVLYGVTMESKGVSKLVSVELH